MDASFRFPSEIKLLIARVRVCVCLCVLDVNLLGSTIPSNIRVACSIPVRGLLERKKTEVALQSSTGRRDAQRTHKIKADAWRIHVRAQHEEGHSLERVWSIASREPSYTPPGSQLFYLAFAPISIYLQQHRSFRVFRLPYRGSRRRFGGRWVGPIQTALEPLKLSKVTSDATSTLSPSLGSLCLCRVSGAFSPFLTHATINLQPPLHIVL